MSVKKYSVIKSFIVNNNILLNVGDNVEMTPKAARFLLLSGKIELAEKSVKTKGSKKNGKHS